MRIIVKFDNQTADFEARYRPGEGDIMLVVRPQLDGNLKVVEAFPQGVDVGGAINHAKKLNLEIIGHSSKGGKKIQSDKTEKYPVVHVGIQKITNWIETELLKQNLERASISLLSCEASAGRGMSPSIAEQMLRLFHKKPKKISAREGFVYIERGKRPYSYSPAITALKELAKQNKLNLTFDESTKVGDKYVFYFFPSKKGIQGDGVYYKVDKQILSLYYLLKEAEYVHDEPNKILKNPLHDISRSEFRTLVNYALSHFPKEDKVHLKAKIIGSNIRMPSSVEGSIDSFKIKSALMDVIGVYLKELKSSKTMPNGPLFSDFLEKTRAFIDYRHLRNYDIGMFVPFINIVGKIVEKGGIMSQSDIKEFHAFGHRFSDVISDSIARASATGLRPPAFYRQVLDVTTRKNTEYRELLGRVLDVANTIGSESTKSQQKKRM